jgi:hypothetical protein
METQKMKVFKGDRTIDGIVVTVDGKPLDERQDIAAISPDGFEWGFDGGAAPKQLALAILAEHFGDSERALRYHEDIAREIIANFANEWVWTGQDIDETIAVLDGSAG